MAWVPISAWLVALVLALVVLGFCGYEIFWKTRRLQADLVGLRHVARQLIDLQARLVETQTRITGAGLR